jgi:hypothetical protein
LKKVTKILARRVANPDEIRTGCLLNRSPEGYRYIKLLDKKKEKEEKRIRTGLV